EIHPAATSSGPHPFDRSLAAQVALPGRGALDLAAGGAADRAARDDHDIVDIQAEEITDSLADRFGEELTRHRAARLHHHHHAVGAAVLGREGDDAAAADAIHRVSRPFEILRVVLPAVDDDQVLDAAADEQLTAGHVAEVAGAQPAVAHDLGGQGILPIVAHHHRRTGEQDFADVPLRQRPAVGVGDDQAMSRQ